MKNKILMAILLAMCVIGFSMSSASATTQSVSIPVEVGDLISVHGCVLEWNNRELINNASLGDAYSQGFTESFYNQVSKYPEFFDVHNKTNEKDGLNEVVATVKNNPYELNININLQDYLVSITRASIYNS